MLSECCSRRQLVQADLAETSKRVFIYFYIKLATLDWDY
jgi:hypothetical protein